MSPLQILVLALVQGVTEFLPISSSAHLILLPRVMGWEDQGLAFDVAVHAGTLGAVLVFSRHRLRSVARAWLRPATEPGDRHARRLVWHVLVATLPVAVAGFLLQDAVATQARNVTVLALASIVFGVLLGVADGLGRRDRGLAALTLGDALFIGLFQALALIPGTSRSGATLTAGLLRNVERPEAVEFSFLLAIPVLFLAAAKDVLDLLTGDVPGVDGYSLLLGMVISGLCGYLVMGWLLAWSRRQSLLVFVAYRVLLGVALLVWEL